LKSEPDFHEWWDRLEIYGLDFKHIPSIYEFCDFIKLKYRRLDILINNAAQTIRREPALNEHIVKKELEVDISQDRELLSVLPNDFSNKRIDSLLIEQKLLDSSVINKMKSVDKGREREQEEEEVKESF